MAQTMAQKHKLRRWLHDQGHTITWLERKLDLRYQGVWDKLNKRKAMTEQFVIRCFQRVPELPADIFAEDGYVRQNGHVMKRIPLVEQG